MRHRTSLAVFAVALSVWLAALHVFFRPDKPALGAALAKGQLTADHAQLRRYNPEWELMGRLFTALSFANLSFHDPAYLEPLVRIANETDALERQHGVTYFLLPYGAGATRSLFVDGEIALMLAARQLRAGGDPTGLQHRVERIERQLEASPILLPESYPDEGWVFCNTVAVAALRASDAALKTDHSA
ncbi:MAG: hypothetical protein JNK82_37020, partial [Myxococcaceae bacterium]|nr:hypothetical protein [Myxococcaceae bacterium]